MTLALTHGREVLAVEEDEVHKKDMEAAEIWSGLTLWRTHVDRNFVIFPRLLDSSCFEKSR